MVSLRHGDQQPAYIDHKVEKQEISKQMNKEGVQGSDLWTDGLICAFEFMQGQRPGSRYKSSSKSHPSNGKYGQTHKKLDPKFPLDDLNKDDVLFPRSFPQPNHHPTVLDGEELTQCSNTMQYHTNDKGFGVFSYSHWVPIGWARISELVQRVKVDENWVSQQINFVDEDDDATVADLATPYWERPEGPTWWCHVAANHPSVISWLSNAQWLYPAISVALRDESRLISERMKYLFYEVPVRVAGGLLFELLGQSVGDPFGDEDDTPIVLRAWQAQNFLITSLHIKGSPSNINVLGLAEVQELLLAGGSAAPKSIHEVIAHLACRLSQWDNRLFRKYVFGAADEIELKFVNRRNHKDMNLLCVILNQEIRKVAMQVIRVKWSLHAREEIIFELLQHLRGAVTRSLLEAVAKSTREMLEEQEAVRGRLFTIQDVMQSTVRAWLQDKSIRITHNLAIFGGCGLVLSIITGIFGINVDGIPGAQNAPYAFGLFAGILFFIVLILICLGMLYLGLKKPINEAKFHVRKLELDRMVSTFQREAETHAKVRQDISRHNLPPTAADMISEADYILID